jgi:hypothetical protein
MLAGCPASLTKTESEALRSRLALEAEVEQAWIGLVRVDSDDAGPSDGWRWVCDDQPLEATEDDWASGEPNDGAGGEDCTISTAPGWVDRPCSDLHPFVCLAE